MARVDLRRAGDPREPEVEDPHPPVGADQHILRLKITVHEPDLVGRREPAPCLYVHVQQLAPRPRLLALPFCQRQALDELHRHEHLAPDLAHLIDLDDVGVRQPGQRLGLAKDPSAGLVLRAGAMQQFDRHAPAVVGVVGRVHHPHAADPVGAMILTRPQASVVEHAVASANDLQHMAALKQYAAAVQEIEQDLGRMRDDNDRQEAVIEAAAALRAMVLAKADEPAKPVARPGKPHPQAPADPRKPTSGKIKICDADDPLAEDC